MECIWTGARVYFANYGMTVAADLYCVGSAIVIRWNPKSKDFHKDTEATHILRYFNSLDPVWHREDIGVTVAEANFLMVNFDVPDASDGYSLPGEGDTSNSVCPGKDSSGRLLTPGRRRGD